MASYDIYLGWGYLTGWTFISTEDIPSLVQCLAHEIQIGSDTSDLKDLISFSIVRSLWSPSRAEVVTAARGWIHLMAEMRAAADHGVD